MLDISAMLLDVRIMDTPVQNTTNDVPAYLNDLIPYRCPKCGHQRRFATLRELRMHLQNDHAFQMGCIKPHSRATTVFSKDASNKYNNLQGSAKGTTTTAFINSTDHERAPSVDARESSPLLRTFKDEANMLEMELQQAKQNEMRNKTLAMKHLANNSRNPEYRTCGETVTQERERRDKQNINVSAPMVTHLPRSQINPEYRTCGETVTQERERRDKQNINISAPVVTHLPRSQLTHSDMKGTLDKLNAEVMRSRLNQWVTSDALYKSQEILSSMEEAADDNVREQQGIVQQLMKDIRTKGHVIEERERDERELLEERRRLYSETEHLVKEADTYNNDLRQELDQRSLALENLTTDMKRLQTISEKELKSKENDLQSAQEKMRRLEWERDKLIDETENILQRADTDNVHLRNTIKVKEEELNTVNQELHKLRQNQNAMLEQTTDIQTRAEKSQSLMKSVLDAKNVQLESAARQLQDMKALQGQLVEESKILTEQADDNTHAMKRLLQNKEDHVRDLTFELERLREEKFRLEESTSSLEIKAEQTTSVIGSLRDVVLQKENDLKTTQSELTDLKGFLQSAAAKERGARKKLEKFIDELIHRAEKAEAELRTLRSQSTNTTSESTPPADRDGQQRKPTVTPGRDQLKEKPLLTPLAQNSSATALSGGVSESTERLGLPTRLSPPKPPRTKLKVPNKGSGIHETSTGPGNITEQEQDRSMDQRNIIHTRAEIHRQNDISTHNMDHLHTHKTHVGGRPSNKPVHEQRGQYEPVTRNSQNYPSAQRRDAEDDNESNTINTNSLLMYLNEGLLTDTSNLQRLPKENLKTLSDNNRMMTRFDRESHRNTSKFGRGNQSNTSQFVGDNQRNAPRFLGDGQGNKSRLYGGSHQNASRYDGEKQRNTSRIGRNHQQMLSQVDEERYYDEQDTIGINHGNVQFDLQRSHVQNKGGVRQNSKYMTTSQDHTLYSDPQFSSTASENRYNIAKGQVCHDNNRQHMTSQSYPDIDRVRPDYNHVHGTEKRYRKRTEPSREHTASINTSHSDSRIQDRRPYIKHKSRREGDRYHKRIERSKRRDMLRGGNTTTLQRYSGVGKSKGDRQSPTRRYKNEKGETRTRKLRQFDSTFPEIYTSMHDLHSRSNQRSKENYESNSRRSRSLSPDVRRHVTRAYTNRKRNVEKVDVDEYSGNESHTDVESAHGELIDEDSQKYALLEESSDEQGEGGFVELMDENGILWASNEGKLAADDIPNDHGDDDDTLPDISDSELDRVSPSGSEAIATKKINQASTAIIVSKVKPREKEQHSSSSRKSANIASIHSDRSKSISKLSSSRKDQETKPRKHERHSINSSEYLEGRTRGNGNRFKTSKVVRISKANDDHILKEGAVFEPIKTVSSSKHSLSDKDLTSGGREVHEYVKQSPFIHIKGSPGTVSEQYTKRSYTSSTNSIKPRGRNTETLEEKLARISDKYKSQRVVIGSSQKDPHIVIPSSSPTSIIDNKVQLINEKYKAKRQAISESKRVTSKTSQGHGQDVLGERTNSTNRDKMTSAPAPYLTYGQSSVRNANDFSRISSEQAPRYYSVPNLAPGSQYPLPPSGQLPQSFPHNHPGLPFLPMPPGSQHDQNPYFSNYTHPGGNNEQINRSFPYLFPYFYPNAYPGLQNMASQIQANGTRLDDGRIKNDTFKNTPSPLNIINDSTKDARQDNMEQTQHSDDKPSYRDRDVMQAKKIEDGASISYESIKTTDDTFRNVENIERSSNANKTGKTHSPMTMKESDIDTERLSAVQQPSLSHSRGITNVEDTIYAERNGKSDTVYQHATSTCLKDEDTSINSLRNSAAATVSNELRDEKDDQTKGADKLRTQDIDTTSVSEGTSMFAVPIDDDLSAACNSNTQSVIDLHGSGVDTDIDTDTESVKRDFFEKANKIRGMLMEQHVDEDDSVSQRSYNRNTMSSASSQASIDFLENIPLSRREETKRRRQALSRIFRFLDTASLCTVAEVCREWKIVSRSAKLWTRIELRNEKVSQKFLFFLARRSSQLKVLILEDIRPRNRRQGETPEDYQSTLKYSLDGSVEQILKRSEASLHTISIVNCGTMLSSKCLWAASCYSRMLRHVTYITDFDPVSSEVMWALGSGCRDLQTLIVHPINPCQNAEKFNTRCAQLIGKCFPVLEHLSIGGKHIDISAVVFIAKQCQKLRRVELHHMSLVTKAVVDQMCEHGFTSLRSIKLMSTPIEPEGITVFYDHCKYLDMIYLRLSVNDYFAGTDQNEDLKVFEDVTSKYEELKQDPKLRRILKLMINKI